MKFTVTMKDPDGVGDSITEAVRADIDSIEGLSDDERAGLAERREEEVRAAIKAWFQYSEYLTVEVDTEAGTCMVRKNNK